jgi:acyl-CoA hydrolase
LRSTGSASPRPHRHSHALHAEFGGVGSLGAAVLDALAEHQDLGFHTGMVTDGLLRLVDKGVANGARKEIDPGLIVAGTALGSAELYNRVAELPARFLPTSYTHSPQVLSLLRSVMCR